MCGERGQVSRQMSSWVLGSFAPGSCLVLLRPLALLSPFFVTNISVFSLNMLLSFLSFFLAFPPLRCVQQ